MMEKAYTKAEHLALKTPDEEANRVGVASQTVSNQVGVVAEHGRSSRLHLLIIDTLGEAKGFIRWGEVILEAARGRSRGEKILLGSSYRG